MAWSMLAALSPRFEPSATMQSNAGAADVDGAADIVAR